MSLYKDVTAVLDDVVDIPDDYELPSRIQLTVENGDVVASGVWSRPLDQEIKRKQEELREYLDEHGGPPPEDLHEAATPDPDATYTRREQVILPEELAQRVRTHLDRLDTTVVLDAHTQLERPHLVCTPDKAAVVTDLVYVRDDLDDGGRMVFDALARTIACDDETLPSTSAVTSVEVHLTGTDDDDGELTHEHDYTVEFETPTPHEYLSDADTIEDYCEKAAENNDDVDYAELMARESYGFHVHLRGCEYADPIVEAIAENQLKRSVDITAFSSDDTLSASSISVTGTSMTIRGSLVLPIED